jgi:hypothetical protein
MPHGFNCISLGVTDLAHRHSKGTWIEAWPPTAVNKPLFSSYVGIAQSK